jgi:hypothetical protein
MSPEQARGEPTDHRTDLFSLGSVLYALCTGRPPFRGDTTAAVLKQVCEATPRPIRETNPDVPEWLCDLIGRLHAKEAYDRIGSARDVADLLSARLALLHESPRVPPAAVGPSRSLRAEDAVARPPAVPPSRWRWVVFACLVALLLALAALAALVGLGIKVPRGQLFPESIFQGNPESVQDGKVTAKGLQELRQRMTFADLSQFEKDPQVGRLSDLFTVDLITRYFQTKLGAVRD